MQPEAQESVLSLVNDRQRLEQFLELFGLGGWKEMIRDLVELEEQLLRIDSVNSERELYYRQGQLAAIRQVLAFESDVRWRLRELDGPQLEDDNDW